MHKVALVTGASRGIGKAIAIQLAKDGYDVIVNYCGNENKANDVVSLIQQQGVQSMSIKADVSKAKEVESMILKVMDTYHRIDVLVNNSGITKDNLMLRMSHQDFSDVIDVNLKGCFHTIKPVSKIMMKQKAGVIINMASVIGLVGNTGQANYAASKAGIIGFTKSVAKELASRNIRCNAIAPGFIQSDMTDGLSDIYKETILNSIPLKRMGKVQDVANIVSFLVSEKARYITGQVIHVDGGMVM